MEKPHNHCPILYRGNMTGDQVFTSCEDRSVTVWTQFVQPDSFIFVDDSDPSLDQWGAPICVGYFGPNRQFVSSELSFCIDYPRNVSSVKAGYYPGQIVYTHNPNTEHDIDRNGSYNAADQLKIARIMWLLSNAPTDTRQQKLDAQRGIWHVLNENLSSVPRPAIADQAISLVSSLPQPPEPDFSITASPLSAETGNTIEFTINFKIDPPYAPRLKLVVPDGVTIGTPTGPVSYADGFLEFTAMEAEVKIPVTRQSPGTARLTVIYQEDDFWNVHNLSVYNSCSSGVQDFVGLNRRDITHPFREATATWTAPLPVTLNYFTATKENDISQLSWATAQENQFDRFVVQRSGDAKSWYNIADITGAGTGSYSFADQFPLDNNNHYRLKMVDLDGAYTFSRIENIIHSGPESARLYPNPASEKIRFLHGDIRNVRIISMNGVEMMLPIRMNGKEVDISTLPQGVYIAKITLRGGQEKRYKFVKTK